MGYTIRVGNARLVNLGGDYGPYITVRAEAVSHPEAPVFPHDGMTANTNERSPSYTVWSDFCRWAGLYELFFGGGFDSERGTYRSCSENFHRSTPLMDRHPGYAAVGPRDAEFVTAALHAKRAEYPDAVPGFTGWDYTGPELTQHGVNAHMARLIWLDFWLRWAVENCEFPVVENT